MDDPKLLIYDLFFREKSLTISVSMILISQMVVYHKIGK